jgi:hypothetical protein
MLTINGHKRRIQSIATHQPKGNNMFTITHIQGGKLYSISTPCLRSASRTYYAFMRRGLVVRLWQKKQGEQQTLVF